MIIFAQGRRTGKTTKLVKMSAETGAIIVSPNRHMAYYVELIANDLGLDIPTPITAHQFVSAIINGGRVKDQKYLIDELQMVLTVMNVEAATVDKNSVAVDINLSSGSEMIDLPHECQHLY